MHEIEQIIEGYRAKIGEVLGVTEDFSIRQSEIDVFGALTQNIDPMHNDPEWGKEGPWGSTIVHGLFLLSYVAKFWKEIGVPIYTNEKMYSLNYGLNRVRFISPFLVDVPGRATVRLRIRAKIDSCCRARSQSTRTARKSPTWWPSCWR